MAAPRHWRTSVLACCKTHERIPDQRRRRAKDHLQLLHPELLASTTANRPRRGGLGREVQTATARERQRRRPGAPAPPAVRAHCKARGRASQRRKNRGRGNATALRHRHEVSQFCLRHPPSSSESSVSPTANRPLAGGLGRGVATATTRGCEQEPRRSCERCRTGPASPWLGPPPLLVGPRHSASTSAHHSLSRLRRRRGIAARLGSHRAVAAATSCGTRAHNRALH